MRSPDANLPRKRLRNCAICLMNLKGIGDDYRDDVHSELVFTERDAIFGLGLIAFPLAGNGARGSGRGCDGLVPSRLRALSGGSRGACTHAAGSAGHFLLLFPTVQHATAFWCSRHREVVAARR